MEEIWKVVPNYPNYALSTLGRLKRIAPGTRSPAGAILKPAKHYGGYWQCALSNNGRLKTLSLSRMLCETFHGPAPSPEHEAAHWDGDEDNNAVSNLRWATKLENAADKYRTRTWAHGTRMSNAKLNELKVRYIRGSDEHPKVLAENLGVSPGLIRHVLMGRAWKHVD